MSRSPLSVNATTDGVVRSPLSFGMMVALPPSTTATQLLVVPKSIPMILPIKLHFLKETDSLTFCAIQLRALHTVFLCCAGDFTPQRRPPCNKTNQAAWENSAKSRGLPQLLNSTGSKADRTSAKSTNSCTASTDPSPKCCTRMHSFDTSALPADTAAKAPDRSHCSG